MIRLTRHFEPLEEQQQRGRKCLARNLLYPRKIDLLNRVRLKGSRFVTIFEQRTLPIDAIAFLKAGLEAVRIAGGADEACDVLED